MDSERKFDDRFGPPVPKHVMNHSCAHCDSAMTWDRLVNPDGSVRFRALCCDRQYLSIRGGQVYEVPVFKLDVKRDG